jgi:hypothetical protein
MPQAGPKMADRTLIFAGAAVNCLKKNLTNLRRQFGVFKSRAVASCGYCWPYPCLSPGLEKINIIL